MNPTCGPVVVSEHLDLAASLDLSAWFNCPWSWCAIRSTPTNPVDHAGFACAPVTHGVRFKEKVDIHMYGDTVNDAKFTVNDAKFSTPLNRIHGLLRTFWHMDGQCMDAIDCVPVASKWDVTPLQLGHQLSTAHSWCIQRDRSATRMSPSALHRFCGCAF